MQARRRDVGLLPMTTPARHLRESLLALGQRVRMLREVAGLTQEEFSKRCQISVSFTSLLERGERSPSFETLLAVANAVGVPVSDLFQLTNENERVRLTPLLEFAREADMSSVDVTRFISVGRAMFGLLEPRDSSEATCSVPSCGGSLLAKGLCAKHYHQERRTRIGTPA
jgi:transcriptional regulator with XRE-family HTH domain